MEHTTALTPSEQRKGKFFAFENQRKRVGDKLPQFIDGEIQLLDTGLTFALPALFTVGGKVGGKDAIVRMYGFTDPYPLNTPIRDRVAAKAARAAEAPRAAFAGDKGEYLLQSGQIVLFPNPNAGQPGKSGNPQTDMYGYWNPGGDHTIVKIGAWMGDKDGKGYINGETQLPLPGKEDGVIPDADPTEALHMEGHEQHEQEAPSRSRRGRRAEADAPMDR